MEAVSRVSAPPAAPAAPAASPAAGAAPPEHSLLWAKDEFSFHDLLDAINPLQHLPIINTIYRWLTGDTIGNVARLAGDFLYGGPIGLAIGAVSATLKETTGRDPGEHVLAMLGETGDAVPNTPMTAVADAPAPAQPGAAPAAPPIQTAAVAAPAVADHAPVPLFRTAGATAQRTVASAPAAPPMQAAQQDFLAQRAAVERRAAAAPAIARSNFVPLQLTGGVAPGPLINPGLARASAESDFSRRMLDALDKYKSQTSAGALNPGPGTLIDLTN